MFWGILGLFWALLGLFRCLGPFFLDDVGLEIRRFLMFWLGLILDLFLGCVLEHCWGHFCNYCATNLIKKRDLFWGLLEAVWSRLGGVLGGLGSLLGSLVFQQYC